MRYISIAVPVARSSIEGRYEVDPDYPEDENEHWYWVRVGSEYTAASSVCDSMEVQGEQQLDSTQALDLVGPGGILQGGSLVAPGCVNDAGQQAFLSAVAADQGDKLASPTPAQKSKRDKGADTVVPKTPLEKLICAFAFSIVCMVHGFVSIAYV